MSATATQIARLRRMVAEPDETTYTDDELAEYVERYPLLDARGEAPATWDTSTTPPTAETQDSWIRTYDLNAAAADVWTEKAALKAVEFSFSTDGQSFQRNEQYQNMMRLAAHYRARRSVTTFAARPEPTQSEDVVWIGNLAETD